MILLSDVDGLYTANPASDQNAKRIPIEEAVPGDIVVFNDYSHNGIYAGNGNYYHAPQPGDRVKLAPISIERFHIVRLVDIVG